MTFHDRADFYQEKIVPEHLLVENFSIERKERCPLCKIEYAKKSKANHNKSWKHYKYINPTKTWDNYLSTLTKAHYQKIKGVF
jgi:hypothetical protein